MSVFNQSRSRVIKLIFFAAFLVLIAQLFNLQVLQGKYKQLAFDNAVFPKIVYPERGIIYDRNGKAILNNTIAYDLMVIPNEVKGIDTLDFCRLLDIDTSTFRKKIVEAIVKGGPVRPSVFQSLLSQDMHARFEENSWKYPGFTLVERPIRTYPFNAGAHILGYVREVSPTDIEKSENFYRQGDYIGKTGLENYYEKILMGQRGVQYMIKDHRNRLVGKYENGEFDTTAIAGRGLITHIDVELQQLAEKLMANKIGAIVAIDPKTGGILSMVSGPNYDPNDLSGTNGSKNFAAMQLDVKGPLLNRAIAGYYEPGSTFKPLGGLVALDENLITPSYGYPCGGRYVACGHGKPKCTHAGGGHSSNLRNAIAYSCNSYFTQAYRLVVDNPKYANVKEGYLKWREYMNKFGLGLPLGVDIPGEKPGNIPDTSVYNRENNNYWTSCTNLTLGIGQDKMQTTALQVANAMCIIANRGFYYTPHFVKEIENETEADSVYMSKYRVKHEVLTHISDDAYDAIIEGMADVVRFGTASRIKIPGIEICAKTGTAQTFIYMDRKRTELKNNGMFVCFAPKENPKIAIAIFLQNAGYGGSTAGPIAKLMIEKYLNDSLSKQSQAEVEMHTTRNYISPHYKRLQVIEDSIRAYKWYELYKDSSKIKSLHRIALENKEIPSNKVPNQLPKESVPSLKSLVAALLPSNKFLNLVFTTEHESA